MSLSIKINGVWTDVQRPYVKRNDVWVAANEAWIKTGGAWVRAYEYDVIPPNPPEITLEVVEDFDSKQVLQTRYIKVGTRLPGAYNDPDARLTRVLTNYSGKPPQTQFGGTFTSTPDKDWTGEPWSEWRYNSYGDHNDTSNYTYKQWPPNVSAGYTIPGDKDYYFGGWSLDDAGNWSAGNQAVISIPKDSIKTANIVVKEARFQPNGSGTWRSDGYHSGDLIQQQNPRAYGIWFHGNQFTDSIGAMGAPTIRSAQIYIRREGSDQDTGTGGAANLYLYWHGYATLASLPAAGTGLDIHDLTKITVAKVGQLAKGEGQWFDLPDAFNDNLNTQTKGMGLFWKDPVKAAAAPNDYSRIVGTSEALRCGEVHVVWEEKL
jgi:hypothetical protein